MAEQKKKETRPQKPPEGDESGAGSGELAKKGKKLKEDLELFRQGVLRAL